MRGCTHLVHFVRHGAAGRQVEAETQVETIGLLWEGKKVDGLVVKWVGSWGSLLGLLEGKDG